MSNKYVLYIGTLSSFYGTFRWHLFLKNRRFSSLKLLDKINLICFSSITLIIYDCFDNTGALLGNCIPAEGKCLVYSSKIKMVCVVRGYFLHGHVHPALHEYLHNRKWLWRCPEFAGVPLRLQVNTAGIFLVCDIGRVLWWRGFLASVTTFIVVQWIGLHSSESVINLLHN